MNSLPSNLVAEIAHAESLMTFFKRTLEQSREAHDYNGALFNHANAIKTIVRSGTLGEMVDAAIALQNQDAVKAADKDKQTYIKQADDAITNFKAALKVYDKLTTDPAWYREYADGFLPKNKSHGLPNDDFRQAIASQNSREGNRDTSINNLPGDKAIFDARRALLAAILREYQKVQAVVLAGDEPPPGSMRTGGGKGGRKAASKKSEQKER